MIGARGLRGNLNKKDKKAYQKGYRAGFRNGYARGTLAMRDKMEMEKEREKRLSDTFANIAPPAAKQIYENAEQYAERLHDYLMHHVRYWSN
jgi:flagellar biosynthesis/type III secretory pathway protein FliH